MNTILNRYIFKELWPPFGISLAFFSFVFIMAELPDITDYIVSYQIGLKTVLFLLAYAMPYFLQFVIPMSVMISVLLTFLRMSGDMEVVAIKAAGISIYRLLPAVVAFGLIGMFLTAGMAIYAMPAGRKATTQLLYEVVASHVDIGIKPRQFIDTFKDVVLYVNEIDSRTKLLKDIYIEDRRSKGATITVVAAQGQLAADPGQSIVNLRLFNGTIYQVSLTEGRAINSYFDTYDIRLDMKHNLASVGKKAVRVKDMNLAQLRKLIQSIPEDDERYYSARLEWHKKFSLPVACLALSILAIPLGIAGRSTKRAYGIGMGLVFFFLYYIMLSAGWVFGETGAYPPVIGMWLPNVVSATIGVVLLVRCVHEKTVKLPMLPKWLERFRLSGQP